MGRRGPAKEPTALKLAKGERRPSQVNYDEPVLPVPESQEPPDGLTGAGREEWLAQIGPLIEAGVLLVSDLTAFENYCRRLTDLRRMEVKLTDADPELAVAKGYLNAVIKLQAQVSSLAQQCGLTPSSRSGVKATKGAPASGVSKMDRYLRAIGGGKPA